MRLSNLVLVLVCIVSAPSFAKEYLVNSQEQYSKLAPSLVAGDKVVLASGTWNNFEIVFQGKGTKQAPITLTAQEKGKVVLSGQSNLRLAGEHLIVSGLVFKNGYTPSGAVIEYRLNDMNLAFHSRVTQVVIDNYNNPDKRESDYWVAMHGQHNRFDHNHLVGKRNKGVTVAVRLNHKLSQNNYHQIDHNYFGYRPTFGSNGGETLRIGTSHYSLQDSHTLVENNYFEKTNGEVEIISVKSGKNEVRGNVFYEAQGTLTLRHGNGNIIEDNVFWGNGVEHTGGIRVINKAHTIRNNYMEGLTGFRFGSGFTVMNGVPNSPINRYHQVDGVVIENNSMIDVKHIHLGAGSDEERSAAPINSVMKQNLIFNRDGNQPFSVFDDMSGLRLSGNLANTQVLNSLLYGVKRREISLKRAPNGLLLPQPNMVKIGVDPGLNVVTKESVGVSWYPKVPAVIAFDSGTNHDVDVSEGALMSAITNAKSGDVLILKPGQYNLSKLVKIDKVLTIKAQSAGTSKLTYERSAMFEIHDGGSLKLDGLMISGKNAPDYSGNSVVRTQKWGMVDNYRFELLNSELLNFDVNHSFHFFESGNVAFADEIKIVGNKFTNFTGDILRLNKEREDLGIYNAEYVIIKDNEFNHIQGALLKLYRGGTDESTFGPHLLMTNNGLNNVGLGKRNKSKASLYLHGTQVANVDNNKIVDSAPFVIEHTVGEPITKIVDNEFSNTVTPSVVELYTKGAPTAELRGNKVTNENGG